MIADQSLLAGNHVFDACRNMINHLRAGNRVFNACRIMTLELRTGNHVLKAHTVVYPTHYAQESCIQHL